MGQLGRPVLRGISCCDPSVIVTAEDDRARAADQVNFPLLVLSELSEWAVLDSPLFASIHCSLATQH